MSSIALPVERPVERPVAPSTFHQIGAVNGGIGAAKTWIYVNSQDPVNPRDKEMAEKHLYKALEEILLAPEKDKKSDEATAAYYARCAKNGTTPVPPPGYPGTGANLEEGVAQLHVLLKEANALGYEGELDLGVLFD